MDNGETTWNKNLCGRDGRTICGPLRVPKSTYVTLAHKRKPKFFYFGCSLVRPCNRKQSTSAHGTDGQTDRVRRNMRPPPREEGRIISCTFRVRKIFILSHHLQGVRHIVPTALQAAQLVIEEPSVNAFKNWNMARADSTNRYGRLQLPGYIAYHLQGHKYKHPLTTISAN